MSDSILASRAGIFPCPRCRQMIFSDARKCRFCAATLDRRSAAEGVDLQNRVNAACNQAKILRYSAGAMWIFCLIGLIPFLTLIGLASNVMFFGVPISLIYWQVRFGNLQSDDKDYARAKRDRNIAFLMWAPAMAFEVVSLTMGLLFK